MAQLEAMGFPTIRCKKALLATGNSDPEAAMEWLFSHMDDPGMIASCQLDMVTKTITDIDAPLPSAQGKAANSGPEPSTEQVSMLTDMGFTTAQAKKALRETVSVIPSR